MGTFLRHPYVRNPVFFCFFGVSNKDSQHLFDTEKTYKHIVTLYIYI